MSLVGGCTGRADDEPPAATARLRPTTIEYANGLSIDVAYPDEGSRPYPVAIMVHGGELIEGDRRDAHLATVAAALRARGYATASIDYTIGTEIPGLLKDYRSRTGSPYQCDPAAVPTGAERLDDIGGPGRPCLVYLRVIDRAVGDVAAAVSSVSAHADQLSLDADRLVIYGESAGSTLALQFGLTTAREHGVVAVAGVASGFRVPDEPDLEMPVLLATYSEDLPNPSVTDADPPDQARDVRADAEQLRTLGAPVELVTFDGAGHVPDEGQADFDTLIIRLSTFFANAGARPRI